MKANKTTLKNPRNKIIAGIVAALFTVQLIATGWILLQIDAVNFQLTNLSKVSSENILADSTKDIYEKPSYDATTNRLVIPALNLSIPYNNKTRTIHYSDYSSDDNGSYVRLAYGYAFSGIAANGGDFEKANCANMLAIGSSAEPVENMRRTGEIIISGKKLNVFEQPSSVNCRDVYQEDQTPKDLLEVLKKEARPLR